MERDPPRSLRTGSVGWVEWSETHHAPPGRARWVSLHSTHPTNSSSHSERSLGPGQPRPASFRHSRKDVSWHEVKQPRI